MNEVNQNSKQFYTIINIQHNNNYFAQGGGNYGSREINKSN